MAKNKTTFQQKWYTQVMVVCLVLTLGIGLAPNSAIAASHKTMMRLKHGTSSNWSGYSAYGAAGSFNSISASWQQPAVSCSTQNSYSSLWVGLDGYNDSTVEQTGTEADCIHGKPRYYAWYEMYPRGSIAVNVPVHAGDQLNASVVYKGSNNFQLTLTNSTSGRTFSASQRLASAQRASAEVVVEAPWSWGTLPLANFGTANFSNALANGQPLGGFTNLDPMTMNNPYGMKSTPSSFDSTKENFSLTWSAN